MAAKVFCRPPSAARMISPFSPSPGSVIVSLHRSIAQAVHCVESHRQGHHFLEPCDLRGSAHGDTVAQVLATRVFEGALQWIIHSSGLPTVALQRARGRGSKSHIPPILATHVIQHSRAHKPKASCAMNLEPYGMHQEKVHGASLMHPTKAYAPYGLIRLIFNQKMWGYLRLKPALRVALHRNVAERRQRFQRSLAMHQERFQQKHSAHRVPQPHAPAKRRTRHLATALLGTPHPRRCRLPTPHRLHPLQPRQTRPHRQRYRLAPLQPPPSHPARPPHTRLVHPTVGRISRRRHAP